MRVTLEAWFEAMHLHNVVLVVHDWGSALGFFRLSRYPQQFSGIAYMEAIAQPLRWDGFGEAAGIFRALRSPEGEQLVLDQNAFVEVVLPRGSIRTLSEEEMSVYRAPYRTREAWLPTLIWPRQIPIDGEPVDVTDIVEGYGRWLAQSSIPKLFVAGDPGAIISVGGRGQAFCRSWPNQREITVRGRHFLQEDSPEEIAAAVAAFVTDVRRDEGRAPIALAEAAS